LLSVGEKVDPMDASKADELAALLESLVDDRKACWKGSVLAVKMAILSAVN
jgi:hypothetical protein